jgi:hypothetical protein
MEARKAAPTEPGQALAGSPPLGGPSGRILGKAVEAMLVRPAAHRTSEGP